MKIVPIVPRIICAFLMSVSLASLTAIGFLLFQHFVAARGELSDEDIKKGMRELRIERLLEKAAENSKK